MFTADKNYYPKTFTGHNLVDTSEADVNGNYIETHEFYNAQGKVEFYWKLKKNSSNEVIAYRVKILLTPAGPSETYQDYDDLT
jgi:hypothetical protein